MTKKWLLDAFVEAEGLDWGNPDHRAWLQSQDLEYHNIDPEEGLFLMLEQQGEVVRLTEEGAYPAGGRGTTAGHPGLFSRCLPRPIRGKDRRPELGQQSISTLDAGRWVLDLKDCVDAETGGLL